MPDDKKEYVTGSWDKTIKLWDPKTLTATKTLSGHSQA